MIVIREYPATPNRDHTYSLFIPSSGFVNHKTSIEAMKEFLQRVVPV